MKDRVPGAPGQYTASVTPEERSKLESGKPFSITLARNDQPLVEGTPYSKAAVLPDDVASALCPGMEDPTPADAFKALLSRTKAKAGFIYPLASEIVPDGFLLCDGAAYSRAEYPELYDAIKLIYTRDANGDIYDDGKTFKVPNLSKRVPVGAGDDEKYELGITGGEETHKLSVEELPSHYHDGVTTRRLGNAYRMEYQNAENREEGTSAYWAIRQGTSTTDDTAITYSTGGGQPHNNMQPYTVVNYIIATGKGDDVGYVVAGTASGGDISVIDDTIVSTEKTWSSQKIADEISSIPSGGGGSSYPAVESAEHPGCYYITTADGEIEWVNPPMIAGVEYRTTERHNGKPVYAKFINHGKGSSGVIYINVNIPGVIYYVSIAVKFTDSSTKVSFFALENQITFAEGADFSSAYKPIAVDVGKNTTTADVIAVVKYYRD